MLKPYQITIIKLMIKQELLLAKLYAIFADQFPEHAEAWNELVKDEKQHAGWLKQLYDAGGKGIVLFDEGKTKTYTMNTYIDHLENVIAKAEKKGLNLQQAITFTRDFEQSLIEKKVFTNFDSVSDKARSVLDRLSKETEKHGRKMHALIR